MNLPKTRMRADNTPASPRNVKPSPQASYRPIAWVVSLRYMPPTTVCLRLPPRAPPSSVLYCLISFVPFVFDLSTTHPAPKQGDIRAGYEEISQTGACRSYVLQVTIPALERRNVDGQSGDCSIFLIRARADAKYPHATPPIAFIGDAVPPSFSVLFC